MKSIVVLLSVFLFFGSCGNKRISKQKAQDFKVSFAPGPNVIIYKLKGKYSKLVSVSLSTDGKTITQYPSRSDVKDPNMLPIKLAKGFWLDRKGVNAQTAFLKYTFEEYANLPEEPNSIQLFKKIKDHAPFKVMYNCGNKYSFKDLEKELNSIIKYKLIDEKFKAIELTYSPN